MKPSPTATILVVDDESNARIFLRNLLEAEGYRVVGALDGPEALAAARTQQPDVVLLDLMMPGMDGYEVCTRLRAEPALALVPIIMLTALDDRASRLQGLQAGADDFLGKPFDAAELRARLRTITRLNRHRRLYEERARFEAAIAHAPEPIVLAELDGTILHRNSASSILHDATGAAPVNFYDCLPPAVAAELRPAVAQPDGPGRTPREAVLPGARRPGTTVEITAGLIPWEGRRIVQFHLRDLTERKVLEAQLLRSQRIELLGQLAGSVVHDMNNVLSAIGVSASLLGLAEGRDSSRHVNTIQAGVQRGAGILRQLLLFARGSDGEFAAVDASEPVTEVADLVKGTFGSSYPVTLTAEAGLPLIHADSTQLHQIVMNLCVNARDAMPDGGALAIHVARRRLDQPAADQTGAVAPAGDYVAISVRDHGTGIPAEVIPRLFDPFFTTKAEGKGTGLGLATVMRLTRRHGGFVTLDTEVGRGTCFTCLFPVPPPAPATPAPLPACTVA